MADAEDRDDTMGEDQLRARIAELELKIREYDSQVGNIQQYS